MLKKYHLPFFVPIWILIVVAAYFVTILLVESTMADMNAGRLSFNSETIAQIRLYLIFVYSAIFVAGGLTILWYRKNSKEKVLEIEEKQMELENEIFVRKGIEAMINDYTSELQLTTEELSNTNDRLKESEKELTHLNQAKDRFFSIIGHDLRAPIGNFKTITEMLLDEDELLDAQTRKELLLEMKNSAATLFELLENLLHWAKSQSNKMPYKPKAIEMENLIEKTLKIFAANAKNKKVELRSKIQQPAKVWADPNSVQSVLRNLLSNAIKFTPKNGKITLSLEKNNGKAQIAVEDTGIGISNENKKKLFRLDKYFTTPGTNDEPGSGLGLILCKEFVEKNNGTIWAESEIGRGSRFIFTLPLYENQQEKS